MVKFKIDVRQAVLRGFVVPQVGSRGKLLSLVMSIFFKIGFFLT